MGTTPSKPPPPPSKKRRRKQARIYDYFPPHTRLRPNSGYMYQSIDVLCSAGKAPISARSVRSLDDEIEDKRSQDHIKAPIPKWRSKWEIDMRPDPTKETLKAWLSMPLPSINDVQASPEKKTPKKKPPKRIDKRRNGRNKRAVSPGSESDDKENEAFERKSVKSTLIDQHRMLHKTDDRSHNFCVQTQRLWNIDARRKSKFLSQDWNLKDIQMQEVVPVLKQPKQSKRMINVAPVNTE